MEELRVQVEHHLELLVQLIQVQVVVAVEMVQVMLEVQELLLLDIKVHKKQQEEQSHHQLVIQYIHSQVQELLQLHHIW